jgi:hypothetical protein
VKHLSGCSGRLEHLLIKPRVWIRNVTGARAEVGRPDPDDICHIKFVIDCTTRRTGRFAYSV